MPYNRANYPPDWDEISRRVRVDSGWRCEGTPQYPDCKAVNGEAHPETGSVVMLTVAHMDHDTSHNDRKNLRALCQRCHLSWDAKLHARHAAETRRQRRIEAGQLEMF